MAYIIIGYVISLIWLVYELCHPAIENNKN
jgi:hypothetical protein